MALKKNIWKYVIMVFLLLAGLSAVVIVVPSRSEQEKKRRLYPKGPVVYELQYQFIMQKFRSLAERAEKSDSPGSAERAARAKKAISLLENYKLDEEPFLVFAFLTLEYGLNKVNILGLDLLDEDEDAEGIEIIETGAHETPILVEYYPIWSGESVRFHEMFIPPVELRKSESDRKNEAQWQAYVAGLIPLGGQEPKVFISLPEEDRKVYVRVVDRAGHKSNKVAVYYEYAVQEEQELPIEWGEGEEEIDLSVEETDVEEDPFACALFVAKTIDDPLSKANTLALIAAKYAEKGEKEKASKILSQVLQTAKTIVPEWGRETVSLWVAGWYARVGELDRALQVARTIEDANYKAYALGWIGAKYAETFQKDKALQILSQAFELVAQVPYGDENRARALVEIVGAYAQAAEHDQALGAADKITFDEYKAIAMAKIAARYAEAGQKDKALETLAEALKVAKRSESLAAFTAMALAEIAVGYAEVGEYPQGLKIAKKIKDADDKAIAMAKIAVKYAQAGQKEKALQILSQAFDAANRVEINYFKGMALAEVAVGYAEVGEYTKALEVARTIEEASDEISQSARLQNFPKFWAKLYIQEPSDRGAVLAKIALKYAETGERIDDTGNKILREIIREVK